MHRFFIAFVIYDLIFSHLVPVKVIVVVVYFILQMVVGMLAVLLVMPLDVDDKRFQRCLRRHLLILAGFEQ